MNTMVTIDFDTLKNDHEKIQEYTKEHNVTILDLLKAALKRLLNLFVHKNKKKAYTYNPLSENKRAKLDEYITTYFKTKVEFAREANLDPTILSSLLANRRCGNALTWKKINDVFEKHDIKLPHDLKIKYEVDGKF